MANESTGFFYWYRRYKVRAVDMTAFQTAMIETTRGLSEGAFGAAVLQGFTVSPSGGGLSVSVSPGIAVAASGYLEVINTTNVIDCTAASGGLPSRSLIVVTPNPTDVNFIPSPTNPFSPVPLNSAQKSIVMLLPGTPSQNPVYPSKGPNDTVLAGLKLPGGTSVITEAMLDFEIRDSLGLNSQIAQNQVKFDSRLRPSRIDYKSMLLKPSQTTGSNPIGFSATNQGAPSKYPMQSGLYVAQDTQIDFVTGLISGGDTTSAPFTPVVPTGNNSIICAITLRPNDTLNIRFGTQGTFAQCSDAIRQQSFAGAGSLPAVNEEFYIAYIIISSSGGAFSDIQVIDSRPFLSTSGGGAGGIPNFIQEQVSGVVNNSNDTFVLSQIPDGLPLVMIDRNVVENTGWSIVDDTITFTSENIPDFGQLVYAWYLVPNPSPITGIQEVATGTVDGVNDTFNLTGNPSNKASTLVILNRRVLEGSEWSLIQGPVFGQIKFGATSIPSPGQLPYAFYLVNAATVGTGPGGSGGGGLTPYGSNAVPLVIDPTVGILVSTDAQQLRFLESNGGAQVITAVPQIEAGTTVGQILVLLGKSDTDYLILQDGNGLSMNGTFYLKDGKSIEFYWTGSVWQENGRI